MKCRYRVCAGHIRSIDAETMHFVRQMGLDGIVLNTPGLSGRPPYGSMQSLGTDTWRTGLKDEPPVKWDFLELLQLRKKIETYGLRLEAIENTPFYFYDRCITGEPGFEEQIENYRHTIRHLGRAGIPILGYHWMANKVWRTSKEERGRGGALLSAFDYEEAGRAPLTHGRVYTRDEIWANYERFIRAVLPVAEQHGVTLALHPDDPPVRELGGVPRLFCDLDGFRRAVEDIAPSPYHKLNFCMGTWAEMSVDRMLEGMRHFGAAGKIAYVHFRNVKGSVPRFREAFLDDGDVHAVEALELLADVGFDGFLIDDHVPLMAGDSGWMHRGRALAVGYIKGIMAVLESGAGR